LPLYLGYYSQSAKVNDPNDHRILELAAVNLLVAEHVARLLRLELRRAADELDRLAAISLLTRERLMLDSPACYLITQAGLDAVGSDLPVPALDVARLRHDIGVTWLWLAANEGAFGNAERVISQRELNAQGESTDADLVLVKRSGWVAVNLLLTAPPRPELERVVRTYAGDPRFTAALFLVDDVERVGSFVQEVAAELGLSEMVQVQRATFS
jgi:hypothetical protein